MTKKRIAGLLFIVGMLAVTVKAWAGTQDFDCVNKTGVDIHHVYVSPTAKDDWGEDILGEDVLVNGQTVSISFPDAERAAAWDLRVEDEEGSSIEWKNLKLNDISQLTLHFENGKAWADVE